MPQTKQPETSQSQSQAKEPQTRTGEQPPPTLSPSQSQSAEAQEQVKGEHGETARNFKEANEKGFLGTVPDPTPNEEYTLEGVTKQ